MAAMKLPSFNAPAAGIGPHSGNLQILGTAGFAGSPFHLLRRSDGFHPMSASALHSAAVSLEMKKSANALTFAGRASSGCYEIQTTFGQAPIGQNGFKLLVQEILCRDKLRKLGDGKSSENRGQ